MSHSVYKGKLTVWKDDRGYGFIENEKDRSVFVHISEFKKVSRRPAAGDIILYQMTADRQGKTKAVNAVIEGAEPVGRHKGKGRGFLRKGLVIVMSAAVSVFLYLSLSENSGFMSAGKESGRTDIPETVNRVADKAKELFRLIGISDSHETDFQKYKCQGKTRCSEMVSCEEATFYLRNCPGVEIDGDGDGIPCERQLCGW